MRYFSFIKKLLHQYYTKLLLPYKKYFSQRSSLFYFSLSFVFLLGLTILYGSWWVTDLTYDSEMESLLSKKILTLLIFAPVFCSLMVFFLIIRIFWYRFQKKKGVLLRFHLVSLFLIITVFPSFLYIYVLDYILKETMDLYLKDQTIEAYRLSLNNLEKNVNSIISGTESFLEKRGNAFYSNVHENGEISLKLQEFFNNSEISLLGVFLSNKPVYYINKNNMDQRLIKNFIEMANSKQFALEQANYNLESNYILVSKILEKQKNVGVFAVTIPHYSLPKEIKSTMQVATRVSQIRLLSKPIKNMLLFLYFYFYFPILSLGIFIFYLKSKNITSPIGELNQAVKNISQDNFNFTMEAKGNNEITELVDSFKYMTKELLLNKEKLKIMSKAEAWRDVAIHLAHELKNPLTPIKLANDKIGKKVMQADFDLYSELLPSFDLINREIKTIGELIKQFPHHSKEIEVQKTETSVRELMQTFKDYLLHHPEIKSNFTNKIPYNSKALIDERAILQVFNNLISNALDSVRDFSNKIISVEGYQVQLKDQLWVEIKICDNGHGIPENLKNKIFEPYFTTKESGTGIGLSICENIMAKHDGRLTFASNKNKTTFSILIPVIN